MTLKDKRIFISGGSGVIGSELVAKLSAQGAILFVGDLKAKPYYFPDNVLYRQGDLNYLTQAEIDAFAPEQFFHLAATFERSTETLEFWEENFQHNVRLSHHLMTLLKNTKTLKKVTFASSYLIYDPKLYSFPKPAEKACRLKETDPIYPRNMCGAAKLLHEVELHFLSGFSQIGIQSVSARIYRSYGKYSRDVISRWIRSLLRNETLTVYKPEGLFDYINAGEVAEGLIRLASSSATGIVNLGNGNARRVSEILTILKSHFPEMKTMSSDLDIPFEGSQANMELFKKLTGWAPSRQLEETIPEMIAFEKAALKETSTNSEKTTAGNILVTSASKKVPLVNALKTACLKIGGQRKVIAGDLDNNCLARHFADDFWEMPKLTKLSVASLIAYCRENNITCIVPARDGELGFFSAAKHTLSEAGIHVMISSPEAVETCLDKLLFFEKTSQLKLPSIATSLTIEDLRAEFYVVKERYGAGSRSLGLRLSREEALTHAKSLENPIFQPFIAGEEFSIDLYVARNGKVKGIITRKRDIVHQGESQVTTSVRIPELEAICTAFAERLGLYGHIVMQAICDPNKKFHLIECNSRFGGASTLSVEMGLDSFYWLLLEAQKTSIENYPFFRSKVEKRQVRYPADRIITWS